MEDRLLFNRERSSGAYGTFVYFISTSIAEIPLLFFNSIIFGVIAILMTGLEKDRSFSHFMFIQLILLLISLVAESLCMAINSATPSFNVANAATSGNK